MTVVDLKPAYAGVRMALWWVLWCATHVDAFMHRTARGRGWRLQRGILAYLTAEVVHQTLHFIVVVQFANDDTSEIAESSTFKAEIFFNWLARSMFLCLILLVSVGYCILRDQLGDSLKRVIVIPVVYGVTSMTFDYILVNSDNDEVVTQQPDRYDGQEEDDDLDSGDIAILILITCLLVKTVVFVCAWVFVFEHLNREIRLLRGENDQETAAEYEDDDQGDYTRPEMQDRVEGAVEAGVHADAEEPKTVADAVGDQAKLLLMTRFRRALVVYIMAMILVNVLPVYIGNSSVEKIQSVITVCENLILLAFVAILAIIFRPTGDNPYLLLIDDLEEGDEGKEVTTELGVMSFEPATPQQSITVLPDRPHGREENAAAAFALADDDDLELMSPQSQGSEVPTAVTSTLPTLALRPTHEDASDQEP